MTIPAPDPKRSFCWRCHGYRQRQQNGSVTMPAKCDDWERCRREVLAGYPRPEPGK